MVKLIKAVKRGSNRLSKFFIFIPALVMVLSLAVMQVKVSYAAGQSGGSAVSNGSNGSVNLYENPATGEVFLKPGKGRVKVGKNVTRELFVVKKAPSTGLPAWTKHITLGALVYMGYGYYNNTGFAGPLQLEENPPATNNNGYNAFNVNRAYLIFIYHPNNKWFLKLTPNIYKSSNNSSTFGSQYFRLKYAFIQFNRIIDSNGFTINLKAGQFPTPMIAWEDGLLGYHFAERTPWGFLGVTSTQAGLGISGKFRANGKIYMAYNAGFFNSAAFHANEDVAQKSPQARISFYPFGADSNLDGLGISGYYAWSESNNFEGITDNNYPTTRVSAILDYKTPQGLIALQYDWAKNQNYGFANSNDGGSWCGTSNTGLYYCNPAGASYPFSPSIGAVGNTLPSQNTEHGIDAFGYYNIGNTKFSVFGLIQRWYIETPPSLGGAMPYGNPYNFQRGVLGIGYHLNSHITLAIDNQNYQFLNAKDYRSGNPANTVYQNAFIKYGQWMGGTNAIFVQARIAF
ncbi:MAG: hypothetical protein M1412_08210 [Deltaproteobacteria bacterium]|nr:hypothetical protein [Deltaproteobacteria bacterium]MCL5893125.1 hypothetical protein [Deltaproteobacteria bacterium]